MKNGSSNQEPLLSMVLDAYVAASMFQPPGEDS
jgi:hypothetical protein